jgi:hypothetical protein
LNREISKDIRLWSYERNLGLRKKGDWGIQEDRELLTSGNRKSRNPKLSRGSSRSVQETMQVKKGPVDQIFTAIPMGIERDTPAHKF